MNTAMKIVTAAVMFTTGILALSYIFAFAATRLDTAAEAVPASTNTCSCACCRK